MSLKHVLFRAFLSAVDTIQSFYAVRRRIKDAVAFCCALYGAAAMSFVCDVRVWQRASGWPPL